MPGNGGVSDELRRSLDRRRTASYRLSCISEHQKENTRSSEDEYFTLSAQGLKTPLLEPVRRLQGHAQIGGKFQRSSDGSTVSPFHLDPEVDGVCGIEAHRACPPQLVLSTCQCATSIEIKGQTEQWPEGVSPISKTPGLASPRVIEVQWQVVRWKETKSRNIYIREHRRTLSGTGFDGPLSSTSGGPSALPSPNDVSSPPAGALSLANCMPCKTRRPRSDNTSGSIGWERNVGKGHNISDSSDFDTQAQRFLISSPSTEAGNDSIDLPRRGGQDDASQLRDAPESALKSCPDFYRRSYSVTRPSMTVFAVGNSQIVCIFV